MSLEIEKNNCCGCSLCANVCPKDCISMKQDNEFFKYPQIDKYRCVECHACERICPVLNKPIKKNDVDQSVYAAWNNDPEKRIISTSGGLVSALSEKIISEGGCVIGAYYRDDFTVAHMVGIEKKDIDLLRQSKYMQSDMGMIYRELKRILSSGRKVLFCGTPCHNAAVRNYIGDNENLYQLDFICRGVISSGVFLEYIKYLENKYKGKTVKVQFKNKDYGWNRFSTKVWFDNGKEYIKDRYHDPYMMSYLRYSVSLRPSCYECHFKGNDRYSDITVGDFWGISKKNPALDEDKGTSLVMINSHKGFELFESLGESIVSTICDISDVPDGNMCLSKSPKKGDYRELFFKDLGKKSFGFIFYRYVLYRKIRTVLSKMHLK